MFIIQYTIYIKVGQKSRAIQVSQPPVLKIFSKLGDYIKYSICTVIIFMFKKTFTSQLACFLSFISLKVKHEKKGLIELNIRR